jgi:phosphatidylserine synthase 2
MMGSSDILQKVFYQTHATSLLLFTLVFLVIISVKWNSVDTASNVKRGLAAGIYILRTMGLTRIKDGTFVRPHPVFWKMILILTICYQFILVFLLFQRVDDVRHWLTYYDASLGRPLPEQSYATDCSLTWSNIQVRFS